MRGIDRKVLPPPPPPCDVTPLKETRARAPDLWRVAAAAEIFRGKGSPDRTAAARATGSEWNTLPRPLVYSAPSQPLLQPLRLNDRLYSARKMLKYLFFYIVFYLHPNDSFCTCSLCRPVHNTARTRCPRLKVVPCRSLSDIYSIPRYLL